jgi:hypothetical protein
MRESQHRLLQAIGSIRFQRITQQDLIAYPSNCYQVVETKFRDYDARHIYIWVTAEGYIKLTATVATRVMF